MRHQGDNAIRRHHTDGGGESDHVFALCTLLGFVFAPRIPDLKHRRLYSFGKPSDYPTLEPLIVGRINVELIRAHWAEILRIVASIRAGNVVGAADATPLRYLPTVRRFIATCSGLGAPDWTGLSVLRVTEFIREEATRRTGHGRTIPASATRSFLRFLAWRGVAPSGLDRAIPRIRRARHASLPTRLSSEQLARLLQRPAAPNPAAYRDRAILSLLAGLGLRAGEVATLELDDLDWHAGQLRLRAGKCRRERVLPLPQEVGAALAEYLQHGRPQHRERRVFLTLTDPARIVQAAAVSEIVQRNLVRASIPLGRRAGAHMLRHTAASRMVNGGASFKEVADVLGHRSLQTTGIYAKLDLDALASVALPWIGGVQ